MANGGVLKSVMDASNEAEALDKRHVKQVYRLVNMSGNPIAGVPEVGEIDAYLSSLIEDEGWELSAVFTLGQQTSIVTAFGEKNGLFTGMLYVLKK